MHIIVNDQNWNKIVKENEVETYMSNRAASPFACLRD